MQTMDNQAATSPALRISAAFAAARDEQRGVLIPYFMCGYPSAEQSAAAILAAAQAGADIIELGMPFSDPLADGPAIQQAGQHALEKGMSIRGCMDIASQVSARTHVPLILMGYYNPLLAYGIEQFCHDARTHGISGLIIPDLPPEEASTLQEAAIASELALIFLVPPTTPDQRIAGIARLAATIPGSFIYCVSLSGVTGVRGSLAEHLPAFLTRVQAHTRSHNLPVVVGFGLSRPEHIATVVQLTDGAVVGSALVKLLEQQTESEQIEAVRTYISSLHAATRRP